MPHPPMTPTAETRRQQLYTLLGDLPDRHREITATKLAEEERPSYILETLSLDLNGREAVPAYFVYPKQHHGRLPTLLYNHAHGNDYTIGKTELLNGRRALQNP
ncbi:MAG: hypothetical protein KDE51_04275, partial [Anaerolineales bacterium]|nr:hypothetical protein [Anaerolineales bacterium]